MTLRELGYSIQDAFASIGDWFEEMFRVAIYGSWLDLTIGQFIVFPVVVVAILIFVGLFLFMVFEIGRGIFRWLTSLKQELAKEARLLITMISAAVIIVILLDSLV